MSPANQRHIFGNAAHVASQQKLGIRAENVWRDGADEFIKFSLSPAQRANGFRRLIFFENRQESAKLGAATQPRHVIFGAGRHHRQATGAGKTIVTRAPLQDLAGATPDPLLPDRARTGAGAAQAPVEQHVGTRIPAIR